MLMSATNRTSCVPSALCTTSKSAQIAVKILSSTKGKLPCEQFLQQIEISRAFLPPVSYGEKCGKFKFVVEIAHKVVCL